MAEGKDDGSSIGNGRPAAAALNDLGSPEQRSEYTRRAPGKACRGMGRATYWIGNRCPPLQKVGRHVGTANRTCGEKIKLVPPKLGVLPGLALPALFVKTKQVRSRHSLRYGLIKEAANFYEERVVRGLRITLNDKEPRER